MWTLASSTRRLTGRFPFQRSSAHGLSLALEDLCCVSVPCVRPVQAPSFFAGPPPLRSVASSALPVRGIHFPARPSFPGSHPVAPAPPRRGLPHPLRSASVVSHDPGGLLLPEPCGVFQPLTPVRFVSRLPCSEDQGGGAPSTRPPVTATAGRVHQGGPFGARQSAEAGCLAGPLRSRLAIPKDTWPFATADFSFRLPGWATPRGDSSGSRADVGCEDSLQSVKEQIGRAHV